MTIWKAIGTTLIEEVNIFDQEAEERYHDLGREQHYYQSGSELRHNGLQRKMKGSQVIQKVSKILKEYGFYIFTQTLCIHYILKYKSLHKVLHFYVMSFLF